ncbi:hypothetical protein [Ancylobacter polymorphus]|uniref:Uncharacterized protein n=1 Tax=Ancylobacter polymorphus TaxID=223390 RepID=A0A9E7A1M4_9HYPH|nr:hypothetical protein [Ancylobacter polymorphus]UOK71470.1 hypothetical protein K9D25_01700 [Ancylobacter polymorphus]
MIAVILAGLGAQLGAGDLGKALQAFSGDLRASPLHSRLRALGVGLGLVANRGQFGDAVLK